MTLEEIKQLVVRCLQRVYGESPSLFEKNDGKGVCERCLVFRFAYYLQGAMGNDYFVDCDYNSSYVDGQPRRGKPVTDSNAETSTDRFVDVIVHKRTRASDTDFICFELKKWDNYKDREKDINNLRVLTTDYGYEYGLYLILNRTLEKTKWMIFQRDQEPSTYELF